MIPVILLFNQFSVSLIIIIFCCIIIITSTSIKLDNKTKHNFNLPWISIIFTLFRLLCFKTYGVVFLFSSNSSGDVLLKRLKWIIEKIEFNSRDRGLHYEMISKMVLSHFVYRSPQKTISYRLSLALKISIHQGGYPPMAKELMSQQTQSLWSTESDFRASITFQTSVYPSPCPVAVASTEHNPICAPPCD